MAWLRSYDPQPWGVWPWLGPLLTLVGLIATAGLIHPLVPDHGVARAVVAVAITAGAELLLMVAVWAFGRRIVQRPGGWRVTLGLDRVRGPDWAPWGIGLGLVFVGRIVLNGVANALTHGKAADQARNLRVDHPSVPELVVLGVLLLAVAPLVEEILFRGVMLRTFMRRLTFWPAALLSSLVFAALHVYEVDTLLGRIVLALNVGLLGLANCLLVRVSGRLTPAIMLHFAYNLFGFLYLISLAG